MAISKNDKKDYQCGDRFLLFTLRVVGMDRGVEECFSFNLSLFILNKDIGVTCLCLSESPVPCLGGAGESQVLRGSVGVVRNWGNNLVS